MAANALYDFWGLAVSFFWPVFNVYALYISHCNSEYTLTDFLPQNIYDVIPYGAILLLLCLAFEMAYYIVEALI